MGWALCGVGARQFSIDPRCERRDGEMGRLEIGDWRLEIGRLIVVSTPAASSPLYQWIRPAL
jgi:hypothetical protein